MNKKITSALGGAAVVTLSYALMGKSRRAQIKNKFQKISDSLRKKDTDLPINPAGHPEDSSLENAEMVSEGSQYGVNYYNKAKQ